MFLAGSALNSTGQANLLFSDMFSMIIAQKYELLTAIQTVC